MKLALISVYNKKNILELTNFLLLNDYNILSTGGTFKYLETNISPEHKHRIIPIENFTGFPEILNGRVKTLHPKIYGGILFDPSISSHVEDLNKYNNSNNDFFNIEKIDLVVVNLYPFEEVISQNKDELTEIENIDIGGVSLLRAAAKNYKNTLVLCNIDDYYKFTSCYKYIDSLELFRKELAGKAFEHVSDYDNTISHYFNPKINYKKYTNIDKLKYGCNPYQDNSYITKLNKIDFPFNILNGTPGYINYLDACQSWLCVTEIEQSLNYIAASSFKHTAPAGVAISKFKLTDLEKKIYDLDYSIYNNINDSDVSIAFIKARNSDPLSSFGDFIAISSIVDETCAKLIKREVSDGIIAEDYTEAALKILKTKKNGKYIIIKGNKNIVYNNSELREIYNIALVQHANNEPINDSYFINIPTINNSLSIDKKEDLILSTITLKYTPSNSIAIAENGQVIGIGAGQQNRVDCIKLAGNKAFVFKMRFYSKCIDILNKFKPSIKRQDKVNAIIKYINNDFLNHELELWKTLFNNEDIPELLYLDEINSFKDNLTNLSLSSDAFFPFRDNIDYAQRYGVKYILNPGGSIQDTNITEACDSYNILMAISGKRMFYH